jgi:RND family efflux transporter MFP subunit
MIHPSASALMALSRISRRAALLCVMLIGLTAPAVGRAAEFIGIVHPLHERQLSVHVGGVVDEVLVQVGQRVAAGQLLLRQDARMQFGERERRRSVLDDTSELRSVEQRREMIAGLVRNAEALYRRAGTVSHDELVKLQLELESLRGRGEQLRESENRERIELELAERDVRLRELRAPIAGVMIAVERQAGEWAAPGEAVLRLVDESVCELRVNIAPTAARQLAAGARLAVQLDDPGLPLPVSGQVTYVAPVVDAGSALVEVRIRIPNADRRIRPGVKGRIRLEGGS